MTAFIILILVAGLAASIYGNVNLLKKIEQMEDEYDDASSYVESLNEQMEDLRIRIMESHARLKDIDKRGAFEADDEVGFFFKELMEISNTLNVLVGNPNNDQQEQPFKTGYGYGNNGRIYPRK